MFFSKTEHCPLCRTSSNPPPTGALKLLSVRLRSGIACFPGMCFSLINKHPLVWELVSRRTNPPQHITNFRLRLTKNNLCFLVSLAHGWYHRADSLWLIQWLQAQPCGKTKPASLVSLHHWVPKLPFPHREKAFYLKELLWGLESWTSCETLVPAKEIWVTSLSLK